MSHAAKLSELTLDEKVSLLDGIDLWRTTAIPRLGIPSVRMSDGPHGLRVQYEDGDHLGRVGSAPATCFPPAVAIASSWNPEVARRLGEALGVEARAAGVDLVLGPGINLKRTPLCGRNFEYYSEDPALTAPLAGAFIAGLQSRGVGATLKHFAANNQETERMSISVEADARTLRELYLAGFERTIADSEPWAVMCAYNGINGVFASEDPWLLTEVLRDGWDFGGLVVSDWGAVSRRDLGVAAGLDLEMPTSSGAGARRIHAAVAAGTLSEGEVDIAARRVLELVDRAEAARATDVPTFDAAAQHEAAYRAALECAVLLENDGILPLRADAGGAVAVLGEFARTPRYQGAGSSQVAAVDVDASLDRIRELVGDRREVRFAPGFRIPDVGDGDEVDAGLLAEAVEAARDAEVAVLFLGLPPSFESESYDRDHLDLPAAQLALLEAVSEVSPRVIVVLSNGGVIEMASWRSRAAAILEGWLLGEAGGRALADLLFGLASPSGRLAETIPLRLEHTPAIGNFPGDGGRVRYGERLLVGHRWYDAHALEVAYPFGHGLTYSAFDYSGLTVDLDPTSASGAVEFDLRNVGDRPAAEVAQLYVGAPREASDRPPSALAGFAKVELAPGESRRVRIPVTSRDLAIWHDGVGRWVVPGGAYELRIGASSRDIRLRESVEVEGERVETPLTLESPAGDWWEHPIVGERFRETVTGRYGRLLADPHEQRLFRPIPLSRMLRFPGFTLDEQQALAWLEELG